MIITHRAGELVFITTFEWDVDGRGFIYEFLVDADLGGLAREYERGKQILPRYKDTFAPEYYRPEMYDRTPEGFGDWLAEKGVVKKRATSAICCESTLHGDPVPFDAQLVADEAYLRKP